MNNDTFEFGKDLQEKLTGFTTSFIEYIKTKSISAVMQKLIEDLQIELLIWSSEACTEVDASLNYNLEPLQITSQEIQSINAGEERDPEQLKTLMQPSPSGIYVFSPVKELLYNNTPILTDTFCVILVFVIPNQNQTAEKIMANVLLDFLPKCLDNLDALTATKLSVWKENEQKFNLDISNEYVKKVFCELRIPSETVIKGISYQYYERSEVCSSIYFIDDYTCQNLKKQDEPGLVWISDENDPTKNLNNADNISYVRKLLEACKTKNVLLVRTEENHLPKNDDCSEKLPIPMEAVASTELLENISFLYKLEFNERGVWRLFAGNNIILEYKEGHYYICEQHFEINLIDKVNEIKLIAPQNKMLFENIFKCLYYCPHGALLIIGHTETIKSEVKRLSSLHKGTRIINEFDLNKSENLSVVQGLASIDGAIMVDYNGICYGFGFVLDGKTVIEGKIGRGSRYNSAKNYATLYLEYAVVFSEDKDIDVINGKEFATKLGLC